MATTKDSNPTMPAQQSVEVSAANLDHLGLDAAAQGRIVEALKAAVEQELRARPEAEVSGYGFTLSDVFISFTVKQTAVENSIGET